MKLNSTILQYLRYALIGGLFLSLLIPRYVASDLFFPFITGKNFAFRLLAELLFGGWLVLIWQDAKYRLNWSWVLGAVAAFVAIIGVADIFGANITRSFWSNFERMEGFVTLIHLFAYFVVLASVLNTDKLWKRFFHGLLAMSVIVGFYSIRQYSGAITIDQGGGRLDATFGNATYLACYMMFQMFIATYFFVREKASWRWLYPVLMAMQLFVLYYTATRGAILGLLGGALLAALLVAIFERKQLAYRKVAIGALVTVVVVIGGFLAVRNADFVTKSPVLSRFASISLTETTTMSRFLIWHMAFEGFKEHPILGWGQENFSYVFAKYYDPGMYAQEPWFDRAHDVFFDWLIAGGVLGLGAYLSMFGAAIWYLWFARRKEHDPFTLMEKSVLTGLLAAYFFQNVFVFDNLTSYMLFFPMLAYIHVRVSDTSGQRKNPAWFQKAGVAVFDNDISQKVGVPVALIATVWFVYFFNVGGYLTNRTLLQALSPHPEGAPKNLEFFKQALAYDSFGSMETREQLMQFAGNARTAQIDNSIKQQIFEFATAEMKKEIVEAPLNVRAKVFLGTLYAQYGDFKNAESYLGQAVAQSPKKQDIQFVLGESYLQEQNYPKALEIFKHAFEEDKTDDQARKIYAAAAIFAGQNALADSLLTERFGTPLVDDQMVINAYAQTKQFDKLIAVWEKRVAAEPQNAQWRLSLAASYLAGGERQKAIDSLQEAIKLYPQTELDQAKVKQFTEQAQGYIKQIQEGKNP